MSDRLHIGLDYGLTGGIVVLKNNKIIFKTVMPTVENKSKEIDIPAIARVLYKYRNNSHTVVEKFGGFFGYSKKVSVSINGQKKAIEAVLTVFKMSFTAFMPTTWQSAIFNGETLVTKKVKSKVEENGKTVVKTSNKKDTKKMALLVARRLFPKEDFRKNSRCTTLHDGLLDAVLLAEYGRRLNL